MNRKPGPRPYRVGPVFAKCLGVGSAGHTLFESVTTDALGHSHMTKLAVRRIKVGASNEAQLQLTIMRTTEKQTRSEMASMVLSPRGVEQLVEALTTSWEIKLKETANAE